MKKQGWKFGKRSIENIVSLHKDLQLIVRESLPFSPYDFGVIEGHRTPEKQFEHFKKGRKLIEGQWVKRGTVVTYKDGFIKKSKHNVFPSEAFDIGVFINKEYQTGKVPYIEVAGIILDVSERLFFEGRTTHQLVWGGHWKKFKDYPHFQI